MRLIEHLKLWNHASVKVIDVRHIVMGVEEELLAYRLPTSAFLYTVRGNAQVYLDGSLHAVN